MKNSMNFYLIPAAQHRSRSFLVSIPSSTHRSGLDGKKKDGHTVANVGRTLACAAR